jgi:UDP-N-acetylglucosamine 2-epimerase (non-hydrolysing)
MKYKGYNIDRYGRDSRDLRVVDPSGVVHMAGPAYAGLDIERFDGEPVVESERPDVVLVPGDVNSTAAAALVAAKAHIPVGHIEAGLRSFDRSMPEEVNRIVTDSLAQLLFTHSPEARENLLAEGHREEQIHAVGNTMIDTLERMLPRIRELGTGRHGLERGGYVVVTLHRPALTDGPLLAEAFAALAHIAAELPVVFPVHPRTRRRAEEAGIATEAPGLLLSEPLGYLEFLGLVEGSAAVLTDSGGIQEETTVLGVPCLTFRENTERPITILHGTNRLIGTDAEQLPAEVEVTLATGPPADRVPPLWDGHAAERIARVVDRILS